MGRSQGKTESQEFDGYHRWLGIPKHEQPPHYYRLLGVSPFEEDLEVIATAADSRLFSLRRQQGGPQAALCTRLLNEVSKARLCLLNPDRKAAYDAELKAALRTTDPDQRPDYQQADADAAALPRLPKSLRSRSPFVTVATSLLGGLSAWFVLWQLNLLPKGLEPGRPQPPAAQNAQLKQDDVVDGAVDGQVAAQDPKPVLSPPEVKSNQNQLVATSAQEAPKPSVNPSTKPFDNAERKSDGRQPAATANQPAGGQQQPDNLGSASPEVTGSEGLNLSNDLADDDPDQAQNGQRSRPTNTDDGNPFEELTFDAATHKPANSGPVVVYDETDEGRKKLSDTRSQVGVIYADLNSKVAQWRPLAARISTLAGEIVQRRVQATRLNRGIIAARSIQLGLQRMGNAGNGAQRKARRERISTIQKQLSRDVSSLSALNAGIAQRQAERQQLIKNIAPLNKQLNGLWGNLNDCRQQFLSVRQPQLKYAQGNFEALKRGIDDWISFDEKSPDAHSWGALCEYELGNYDRALQHVETAGKVRGELMWNKPWATGDALRGMITSKLPRLQNQAKDHFAFAKKKLKGSDWQANFLLGRAEFDNPELAVGASAYFKNALKVRPNAACVEYWYGQLKATSTNARVRDVEGGTQMLERLWDNSPKTSWRLSAALTLAYDAGQQSPAAESRWALTLKLAPHGEHSKLIAQRTAAKERMRAGVH